MALDLSTLNTSQREGVVHTEGPTLIIAGPGSGKTRVLTYRVAYLIEEQGIPPYKIMVLTFTRKAANEMKTRLQDLIGPAVERLSIGTFHSVFSRILRREASVLDFTSDFSIYDQEDSKNLLKRIIKELKLDKKWYDVRRILRRISHAKSQFISAKQYADTEWRIEDERQRIPLFYQVYAHYEGRCRKENTMDYEDLLFYTRYLFQKHPDVLATYQERYHYILVDEFQDTSESQLIILKNLVAKHQNLCGIGDDAQSIYSFRGADIRNILTFSDHFSSTKVIKLVENYRSTKAIVQAASKLITYNTQHAKNLVSKQGSGEPILVFSKQNEFEEARFIADHVLIMKQQKQLSWDDITILYRQNSQSRALEEALMRNQIPYQVLGSLSFYQRKEIKDLLAYLHLIVNENNGEALRRAIQIPKRNVGPVTFSKIESYASHRGCTMLEAMLSIHTWLQGAISQRIYTFAKLIADYRARAQTENAYTIAQGIATDSGIMALLQSDKSDTGQNRYDNLQELLNSIKFYCKKSGEEGTLRNFLESIALIASGDENEEKVEPKVKLMTVHKAKGLEFEVVYIASAEEGFFPSSFSFYTPQAVEEERRLFFVAMTRAKTNLIITHARNRYQNGKSVQSRPSRFLKELGLPMYAEDATLSKEAMASLQSLDTSKPTYRTAKPLKKSYNTLTADQLRIGMSIIHDTFERGTIEAIDTSGKYTKLRVNFAKRGKKTLLLEYAKIGIL